MTTRKITFADGDFIEKKIEQSLNGYTVHFHHEFGTSGGKFFKSEADAMAFFLGNEKPTFQPA